MVLIRKFLIYLLIICSVVTAGCGGGSAARSVRAQNKGLKLKRRSERGQKKRDWKSTQRNNKYYHSQKRRKVNKYSPAARSNRTLRRTRQRGHHVSKRRYSAVKGGRKGLFHSKKYKGSKVK